MGGKRADFDHHAVVLAAGAGSRFGGGKLMAPYRNGRLLDGALASASAAPVSGVTLVTGHDGETIAARARVFWRTADRRPPLSVVHAPDHEAGLSASLRAGLESLPDGIDGVFVFLGDMPDIPSSLPARLAVAMGSRLAAAPTWNGRRGHPVLFGRALFPRLRALTGDKGAGALLDGLGHDVALVAEDDAGVLRDVDRVEDLVS